MIMHRIPDAERARTMSTEDLRNAFLVQGLFVPGQAVFRHVDLDRAVLGGVVPLEKAISLDAPPSLAASYFTERRECGVLNIGGPGTVVADGQRYALGARDVLYVARGTREVSFESDDAAQPARFYLVSYPAHVAHTTTAVTAAAADRVELGTTESANRRSLAKYLHPARLPTGQLVMGVTSLAPGSVWNTMPSHTHERRTEVYLYFDLPADAVVVHLMGEPSETRHLVVRNDEVVLSPNWSVHSGCGTSNYAFCWAMGGENQDFADMQTVDMKELK